MTLIMLNPIYTTKDIIKVLNIQQQRLRVWLLNDYISPTIRSSGQGVKALFTISDIVKIMLFIEFINFGLKRSIAAEIIHTIGDITMVSEDITYSKSGINITVPIVNTLSKVQQIFNTIDLE